ncbi:hybrid sensor histidine kinase/response regulator [Aestuariibacter salexigens]|uniref:hybrid sensor histidine kinase/response regulator n=1 Tax=Aestuariibacter salexigens TaxID=226010 RepID=UPI0003FEC445|nr:ATP-binding protein [Aestuariibacter salexigens]
MVNPVSRSLGRQLALVVIALSVLLLAQIYLLVSSQEIYEDTLNQVENANEAVVIATELERDVIDMQRNVLIVKETLSASVSERINQLLTSIDEKLLFLSRLSQESSTREVEDYITRMQGHLNDYRVNLQSVLEGKRQQGSLLNDALLGKFDDVAQSTELSSLPDTLQQSLLMHIASARSDAMSYLRQPAATNRNNFKANIDAALALVSEQTDTLTINAELRELQDNFEQLNRVTRGFSFLSNVVMTGSANEILYLAKRLKDTQSLNLESIVRQVSVVERNTETRLFIFTTMILVTAFAAVFFITRRAIRPVQTITSIFDDLAQGRTVTAIPYRERSDEIGQLATAADIFMQKNELTERLLEDSQNLVLEQQALNDQLDEEKRKAIDATNAKSLFLANMSHEIRTPMNGIIGLVQILKRQKLSDKQRDYVDKIEYSGKILMSVINDILDFSKIEAGKMDLEIHPFSINTILENIVESVASQADKKDLYMRLFIDPAIPDKLLGDSIRISQILFNIINNAIKFTETGGIGIRVLIERQNGNELHLNFTVSDTGIGISEAAQKTIFSSFSQADGNSNRKYGGTGLGLAIVKQLSELMGGHVELSSQQNKGTTVEVYLCLKIADDAKRFIDDNLPISNLVVIGEPPPNQVLKYCEAMRLNCKHSGEKLHIPELPDPASTLVMVNAGALITKPAFQNYLLTLRGITRNIVVITEHRYFSQLHFSEKEFDTKILVRPFSLKKLHEACKTFSKTTTINSDIDSDRLPKFTGTVLLAEDNVINQEVAVSLLVDVGLTVEVAEDGQQAVSMINDSPDRFNLIIMDIQMPNMDGLTATKQIRDAGYADLPICGLSANAMQEDREEGIEAGMNAYLIKPIDKRELYDVLQTLLPN